MVDKTSIFALAACTILGAGAPACAQNGAPGQGKRSIIDELGIPDSAGANTRLTGRAAIAAVIGKPVIMNFGENQLLVFNFESQNRVRVKRPAPNNDEIVGTITNDRDSNKVCFDFAGRAPATCDRLEFQAGKFVIIANTGRRIEGSAMMGLAQGAGARSAALDATFCDSLRKILGVAKSGAFDSLIDRTRPKIDQKTGSEYVSKMNMNGNACKIDTTPGFSTHTCQAFTDHVRDSDASKAFYESAVERAQACLAKLATRMDIHANRKPGSFPDLFKDEYSDFYFHTSTASIIIDINRQKCTAHAHDKTRCSAVVEVDARISHK